MLILRIALPVPVAGNAPIKLTPLLEFVKLNLGPT